MITQKPEAKVRVVARQPSNSKLLQRSFGSTIPNSTDKTFKGKGVTNNAQVPIHPVFRQTVGKKDNAREKKAVAPLNNHKSLMVTNTASQASFSPFSPET